MNDADAATLWYATGLDVFLNRWFARYEAARESLEREGGFLFPYKHHFFVCQSDAVRVMGLDPDDLDWKKIGQDCVKPLDEQAYQRLLAKRIQVMKESHPR